ncbi:Activin types I and II receptor domain protein, partial [Trichostrongylus colubriformis]
QIVGILGSKTVVKLLICADCLGNETLCRDTCLGFYCYKYEVEGPTGKCVKRGCLNNSDPLAKVNECSPPTSEIGRLQEKFIICRPDLCNNSPSHFFFSVVCFILFSLIRIIS